MVCAEVAHFCQLTQHNRVLEGLETEARGAARVVGRSATLAAVGVAEEEVVLVAGVLLGVGALGISLRRSQRDVNCRPK